MRFPEGVKPETYGVKTRTRIVVDVVTDRWDSTDPLHAILAGIKFIGGWDGTIEVHKEPAE